MYVIYIYNAFGRAVLAACSRNINMYMIYIICVCLAGLCWQRAAGTLICI